MTRRAQESPVPEIVTPGLRWRGLETAYGKPTRARSWKRRIQPRGASGALRQSPTLHDGSDPATAVRLYEKLITRDKVELALGPQSSPIADAVADVTERHTIPMVALAATTSIL